MEIRPTDQRKQDAIALLESEVDLWIATANQDAEPWLIPLSFAWDGEQLVMATPARSRTARDLTRTGRGRVAIGPTRDVVIVEGTVEFRDPHSEPTICDFHAARAGFDARETDERFTLMLLCPVRIQAWRNPGELADRDVMRAGEWLA